MKVIIDVLEKVYNNRQLRRSVVPLFIGNPGLGKTVLIDQFAKAQGVNLVELITSQRNPFEISGMPMPDKDLKKMSIWDFDTLLEMQDGDILFFDELLNGNPVTLNACLTLLEQRKTISGKKLPDIMIVAAANPQGKCPLTPQIKERFIWYDVKFDQTMWFKYMVDKYSISKTIGGKLSQLIKDEPFTGDNFMTPRSIDKAVNMIINDVPTPYSDTIKPILSELIKNPFEEQVQLDEERLLEPSEMISWLDLIKIKNKQK
jgi:MoxR-like ATPase